MVSRACSTMRLDETLHHPYIKSMGLTVNALNDSHIPNHEDKSCQGIFNSTFGRPAL
jgi:hypothetical protein